MPPDTVRMRLPRRTRIYVARAGHAVGLLLGVGRASHVAWFSINVQLYLLYALSKWNACHATVSFMRAVGPFCVWAHVALTVVGSAMLFDHDGIAPLLFILVWADKAADLCLIASEPRLRALMARVLVIPFAAAARSVGMTRVFSERDAGTATVDRG
jgi:hypothetical protein